MQAMGAYDPNSPAAQDEEESKAFKWPSLNGAKEEKEESRSKEV